MLVCKKIQEGKKGVRIRICN